MLRWILFVVLSLVSTVFIIANWQIFFAQVRRKSPDEPAPSFVPFIGAIIGLFAMLQSPIPAVRRVAWIPFLLDVTCVPSLLIMIAGLLRRRQ